MSWLQSLFQFLFLLYIFINGFSANHPIFVAANRSSAVHFEMIHRHDPTVLGEKILNRSESIKELFHVDKRRMEMIVAHYNTLPMERRRTTQVKGVKKGVGRTSHGNGKGVKGVKKVGVLGRDNSSFSLPIRSGSYAHLGSYFVSLKVGTPAQIFLLVVDTGSSLTWMDCKVKCLDPKQGTYCNRKVNPKKRIFHSERSRTFRTVPCSSNMCRQNFTQLMSVMECPTAKSPCAYQYNYVDGMSKGIFAYDSVTVTLSNGQKKKIHDMLIGCNQVWKTSNPIGLSNGDGIMGLGFNTHSFGPRVFDDFHGKFSYCLMDRFSDKRVTNYLTFGNRRREEMPSNMKFTELGLVGDFYAVQVTGIYVDGVKLNIPAEIWNFDKGSGMIIDSGFTLTSWVREAYEPIMNALEKPLLKHFRKVNNENFDSCFSVINTDKMGNEVAIDESLIPKFEIEFKFGVRFKAPVKSYFIYVDENVNCIGFVKSPDRDESGSHDYFSILGNVMQQNHMWEFNPFTNQLGFAPSTCELRHHHA
ncbi:aspartic proteinase NANA, chloroplast-like [Macadamia integrifolia]|uniref:aspartic proteinase NANA, chloroplast-like n=1 Tax=Macadamia integrifolia TaxID=60698 RepID=UPI001C52F305|nr:aspartic proteinase NANA, chloroplast-like [Macadamia integrifolia]